MQAGSGKNLRSPRRWPGAALITALLFATQVGAADQRHELELSPDIVREALQFARSLRPMFSEFYVTYMRFPASMHDIGDPTPPASVELRISATGIVTLRLARGGDDWRRIYLVPRLANGRVRWQCVSPDIVTISSFDTECEYSAGFTPPARPTAGAYTPDFTLPGSGGSTAQTIDLQTRDGKLHSIDPVRYYHSLPWDATGDFPRLFTQLTDDSRSRVIAVALKGNAGQFEHFGDLLLFSRWLSTAGPAAVPYLEAQLDEGYPDSSGAALVAICQIERETAGPGGYRACYQERLAAANGAVAYLVGAAARSIEEPPPGYWLCDPSLVELLGAMGPASRPAIPTLLPRLNPPDDPSSNRYRCSRQQVADALLGILGPRPTRTADQAVVRAAIGTLMEEAVFGRKTAGGVPEKPSPFPPRRTVLDAAPWSEALQERLDAIATRQMRDCSGLGWGADALIAELGRTGFRVVNQFVNQPHLDESSGCVNQGTLAGALTALLKQYPEEARGQFARARTPLARDMYIAGALGAIAGEIGDASVIESPGHGSLDAFLRDTGYVTPIVHDGVPQFSASSGLKWLPLEEGTSASVGKETVERVAALQQSMRQLAADYPGCALPGDDALLLRRASTGRMLSILECSDDYSGPVVVIGSPAGFKVMHFPDRLPFMQQAPRDSLIAAGSAHPDGAIVLVVQEPCGGHWRDCAEDDDAPYAIVEEDGDWFTYLRTKRRGNNSVPSPGALR